MDFARDYRVKTAIIPTAVHYERGGGKRPWPPWTGTRCVVRFAEAMDYDDLLERYEPLDPEQDKEARRDVQQIFADRVMAQVAQMLSEAPG